MQMTFHINFNGNCRQAFEFYRQHIGARIDFMLPFRESPEAPNVPDAWQEKIIHASMTVSGVRIAGGDVLPEHYEKPSGVYLLLSVQDEEQTRSIFSGLAQSGQIILPLQKTFWSPCYGIVVDRFGVPWKLNYTVE